MKRNLLAIILAIFALAAVYGQNSREPIDLILLLDTSTGMSSSYDNVNNYITGSFLKEFMRVGDTFHLIAFSQTPRLDVARRISASGDVETIIARMMLQYPIERGSNIAGVITYAEQYISGLPSRPKKIVLVTTGGSDTENLVSAASQRLSSKNATIDFVRVTPGQAITNVPSSARGDGGQSGRAGFQESQGGGRGAGNGDTSGQGIDTSGAGINDRITSDSGESGIITEASGGESGGSGESGLRQDDSIGSGAGSSQTGTGPSPSTMTDASSSSFSSSLPWIIGLILLLLLIIGLIVFLSSRRLGSSPNRVMAEVASSKSGERGMERVDHSKDLARYAAVQNRRTTPYSDRPLKPDAASPVVINPHGPLLLNLFVEDQNTAIGKRNIHSLKSGYSLSVGGGRGDGFLIFLVPIPANIGELRRNGSTLTFIPKKAKYFPDLGSNELRDCLNKTIRIISDKNYELRFRFEMYEDPLIALNRMLNSIKVPG